MFAEKKNTPKEYDYNKYWKADIILDYLNNIYKKISIMVQ